MENIKMYLELKINLMQLQCHYSPGRNQCSGLTKQGHKYLIRCHSYSRWNCEDE